MMFSPEQAFLWQERVVFVEREGAKPQKKIHQSQRRVKLGNVVEMTQGVCEPFASPVRALELC